MESYMQKACALLSGALTAIPGAAKDGVSVLVIFMTLDMLTGVWLAGRCGEIQSHTMREQLFSKSFQYASLVGLGWGAALIGHQPVLLSTAIGVCVYMEAVSILENLVRLENCGGAPLGPARPFLQRIEKYLAASGGAPQEDGKV